MLAACSSLCRHKGWGRQWMKERDRGRDGAGKQNGCNSCPPSWNCGEQWLRGERGIGGTCKVGGGRARGHASKRDRAWVSLQQPSPKYEGERERKLRKGQLGYVMLATVSLLKSSLSRCTCNLGKQDCIWGSIYFLESNMGALFLWFQSVMQYLKFHHYTWRIKLWFKERDPLHLTPPSPLELRLDFQRCSHALTRRTDRKVAPAAGLWWIKVTYLLTAFILQSGKKIFTASLKFDLLWDSLGKFLEWWEHWGVFQLEQLILSSDASHINGQT